MALMNPESSNVMLAQNMFLRFRQVRIVLMISVSSVKAPEENSDPMKRQIKALVVAASAKDETCASFAGSTHDVVRP